MSTAGDCGDAFVDHYAALGLTLKAEAADVRKAFLRQALATHPDKNLGLDPKIAEANFVLVQKAYEVLGNPTSREAYNGQYFRWLRRGRQAAAGAGAGATGVPPSSSACPAPGRSSDTSSSRGGGGGGARDEGNNVDDDGDDGEPDHKKKRRSARSSGGGASSPPSAYCRHDWQQYRSDAARQRAEQERSSAEDAARQERLRRARAARLAAAQGAVQEIYDDRVGEGGARAARTVKLQWKFPFERPSGGARGGPAAAIRRLLSRLPRGGGGGGGGGALRGYDVRAVRPAGRHAAVVELGSVQEAEDLIHGNSDCASSDGGGDGGGGGGDDNNGAKPLRPREFTATWMIA
jgi:curved DNA-binding protein CbpA